MTSLTTGLIYILAGAAISLILQMLRVSMNRRPNGIRQAAVLARWLKFRLTCIYALSVLLPVAGCWSDKTTFYPMDYGFYGSALAGWLVGMTLLCNAARRLGKKIAEAESALLSAK